ncbi:MAG: beta-galactosidase, partial [Armatimonadetes bacterium]|nr:beta-galactosidase [Armatimonadota bacterium]
MTLIRHPFALTSIMALSSLNLLRADPRTSDWAFKAEGPSWQLILEHRVIPQLARVEEAVVISYPWNSPSQPGQFAQASREVSVAAGKRYTLTFLVSDSFTGLTAGYHFLQVLVDGTLVWEADVAGGDLGPQPVSADITDQVQGKQTITVALRVFDKKAVTNFAVEAWWGGVKLSVDQRTTVEVTRPAKLAGYRPYPPDPPIPSLPLAGSDWTRNANLLQPWGATQWVAVAQRQQWLPRWREEFGFNAISVLPPDSHNSITEVFHDKSGRTYITEDAFQAALKDYRKYGLRVILYSGIMHCGHAPVWQFGQLSKEHPDWSMRDKDGDPVMDYGAEWLCPSSPALDYTINYTIGLIRRYEPDAIMLDNNQFFTTGKGPTCYCVHCQRKFREYMVRRFTPAQLLEFFNLSPGQLTIPTDPGPLFNLWIHWRNRVWAEATEEFRRRLRAIKSDLVLLANTAYDYPGWLLAGDLQYGHEDAVLSESRGLSSWGMAEKMVVGRALAKNRPLWNYIGTFDDNDFRLLRDANTIRLIISASLTHCANPWIVFYGFDEMQSQNAPSLAELGRYLRWYREHEQHFVNVVPYSPLASIISLRSRSYLNQPLLPSHVGSLLRRHLTPVGLADEYLFESDLKPFRVIAAEGVACLSDLAAEKLVRWIRSGGT